MTFVDTNYFVRFLLHDAEDQHKIVSKLFEDGALGKKELCTSTIVFFEIYWLFTSFYKKSKEDVCIILRKILSLSFIVLDQRNILELALTTYETANLDLEDCYNIAFADVTKCDDFATFDKKLLTKLNV